MKIISYNREEIIKKVDSIKKRAEKKGATVILNPNDIHENRQDACWYGGIIGKIKYRNITVNVSVQGDMVCTFYDIDNKKFIQIEDKNNKGDFYSILAPYIKNDEQINDISIDCCEINNYIIKKCKKLGMKYILCINSINDVNIDYINDLENDYIDEDIFLNDDNAVNILDIFDKIDVFVREIDYFLDEPRI